MVFAFLPHPARFLSDVSGLGGEFIAPGVIAHVDDMRVVIIGKEIMSVCWVVGSNSLWRETYDARFAPNIMTTSVRLSNNFDLDWSVLFCNY